MLKIDSITSHLPVRREEPPVCEEWVHLRFVGFSGRRNAGLSNPMASLSFLRTYKGLIAFSALRPN